MTMKKISIIETSELTDELLPEYQFNYAKAKLNRFSTSPRLILLDKDVAQMFTTPDAVNKALRALMDGVQSVPELGPTS